MWRDPTRLSRELLRINNRPTETPLDQLVEPESIRQNTVEGSETNGCYDDPQPVAKGGSTVRIRTAPPTD